MSIWLLCAALCPDKIKLATGIFCSFQAVCHISVVFICRMSWWTCYQCIPPVCGGKKCRLVISRCWSLKWCNERQYERSTISVPLVLLSSLTWTLKRWKRFHHCFSFNMSAFMQTKWISKVRSSEKVPILQIIVVWRGCKLWIFLTKEGVLQGWAKNRRKGKS